jgi:hypothetical protein
VILSRLCLALAAETQAKDKQMIQAGDCNDFRNDYGTALR